MFFSAVILLSTLLLNGSPAQAATISERLAGRILLAVQSHGEAWYVDPVSLRRAYLGRPADAFNIMTGYGLGITNSDLAKIPEVGSTSSGDVGLTHRLAGRILLAVQSHGEAWYVDPVSLRRAYLGRPADAFNIMTGYGLGITNADLDQITMTSATVVTNVPFTAQAPLGEWSDPRQADGCEEAAALMAVAWARAEPLSPSSAKASIIAMSDWEETSYGYFQDTSIADTATRLLNSYLNFSNYAVRTDGSVEVLQAELAAGKIVIVPINGQVFQPFHYTPPGPARHMVVVHGYDPATRQFLVHDPGTAQGANLRVTEQTMTTAWRDYASGEQVAIPNLPKSLIVISK